MQPAKKAMAITTIQTSSMALPRSVVSQVGVLRLTDQTEEGVDGKWFVQDPDGPELTDATRARWDRREDDGRDMPPVRPQSSQHVPAGCVGQVHVQAEQVIVDLAGRFDRFLTTPRLIDAVSVCGQRSGDRFAQTLFVVYQEDRHPLFSVGHAKNSRSTGPLTPASETEMVGRFVLGPRKG